MSRLLTRLSAHRRTRARLREERAFARALGTAPTTESAHELRSLATRC
ncbi:hypothetical protein ACI784_06255 [Geodermatophilus sp. SYSU D01186]